MSGKTLKQFLAEAFVKQPGTQLGSNPGGIHVDDDGSKHYIKKYHNAEQAKAEVLAGKIYDHMGIKTLTPEMHDTHHVKTKWNDNVSTKSPSFYNKPSAKHAEQLGKIYHAAILTKNWDILGPHDLGNIVHNKKTDDLHSIDHGGAFHFRAQGGYKNYDSNISEKETLLKDQGLSSRVFNNAFKHHPGVENHALESIKNINHRHIKKLFEESGLSNWRGLHDTFNKRFDNLLSSYK